MWERYVYVCLSVSLSVWAIAFDSIDIETWYGGTSCPYQGQI